jgi:hypothetical protein
MRQYTFKTNHYVTENGIKIPTFTPYEEWSHFIRYVCAKCREPLMRETRIKDYCERGNWCVKCDRFLAQKSIKEAKELKETKLKLKQKKQHDKENIRSIEGRIKIST